MKKFVLGTIALISLAGTAVAADLPQRPVYKAEPIMSPVPVYNWTGFYVGGNIGGAWGHVNATDVTTGATVSPNNTGFAGGFQVGYDWQAGPWVFGIRNLFDGTSIRNSATISDPGVGYFGTVNSNARWFDTLTGRAGYLVQPNVLLYAQGGAAWTSWTVDATTAGATIGTISGGNRTGWTVGGGAEWMFMPHWSTFIEYNYMGFGTRSAATTACLGGSCAVLSAKSDLQNLLVGVNYKF